MSLSNINQVTPYRSSASKKAQVTHMFDTISPSYDRLNCLMTLGIDQLWRKRAIKELASIQPKIVLDVATGTGDFALAALELKPDRIIGLDVSVGMLEVGRNKMQRQGVEEVVQLIEGDSERLQFNDASFDAATVGFGVRNFENLEKGMREICRVIRPGGRAVILEPAFPQTFPLKQLFSFYFKRIVPVLGRLLTRDTSAYNYLPESVGAFPSGKQFIQIGLACGFASGRHIPLTFGTCALYVFDK